MKISFPVAALLLILAHMPATAAQEKATENGPDHETRYANTPWHLVDLWWDLGRQEDFESYSIDVSIHDAVPESVNLYIAPIGLAHLNKTQFYGGLQTHADGYTRLAPQLRGIGRGLLMSMWGERSADAIRPSLGGVYQSSGHEGDFVSVRRAYDWTQGTYTYRVVRMDRDVAGSEPCTWVGAFLYNHLKDEHVFIGALRFPGEDLVFGRSVASFVEIYGRRQPVAEIPRVKITFGNLQVNGRPVAPAKVQAIYPDRVPDYAEAQAVDGRIVVQVGQQIPDRQQRRVTLLPR